MPWIVDVLVLAFLVPIAYEGVLTMRERWADHQQLMHDKESDLLKAKTRLAKERLLHQEELTYVIAQSFESYKRELPMMSGDRR